MMLTGDPINACDAKNYGIVDALSDDDKLLKNALIFSKKIMWTVAAKWNLSYSTQKKKSPFTRQFKLCHRP